MTKELCRKSARSPHPHQNGRGERIRNKCSRLTSDSPLPSQGRGWGRFHRVSQLAAAFAFFFLLFLTLSTHAAPRPPLVLTLPSADTYCYWMQTKAGPVGILPVTVMHAKTVQVAAPMMTGDTVFVIDAHTGEVASRPVSIALSGAPLPIGFVLADFQPIHALASAAPIPAQTIPADGGSKPNGVQRLLTALFSLALLGGVVWVVLQLIKTRGEPLRQLARRAGIEVPDSHAAAEDAGDEPPVYKSEKRPPEAVPESASLLPIDMPLRDNHSNTRHSATLGRGPALPLSDVPALLGLQGLAAGSTFALTDGDVTVGRDGDNEIVLAENTVSRRHARLLRDSHGQFTLSDLDSANGVYINGTRIQRAILSAGDEIKIGDNYFRFQAAKENL